MFKLLRDFKKEPRNEKLIFESLRNLKKEDRNDKLLNSLIDSLKLEERSPKIKALENFIDNEIVSLKSDPSQSNKSMSLNSDPSQSNKSKKNSVNSYKSVSLNTDPLSSNKSRKNSVSEIESTKLITKDLLNSLFGNDTSSKSTSSNLEPISNFTDEVSTLNKEERNEKFPEFMTLVDKQIEPYVSSVITGDNNLDNYFKLIERNKKFKLSNKLEESIFEGIEGFKLTKRPQKITLSKILAGGSKMDDNQVIQSIKKYLKYLTNL